MTPLFPCSVNRNRDRGLSKNYLIKEKTAHDIDERVERVLRGLGNPEPPLRLEDVRELLKLDRAYYTADDPSLIRETVSRIRVATIQVYQRPTLLLEAIKKFSAPGALRAGPAAHFVGRQLASQKAPLERRS